MTTNKPQSKPYWLIQGYNSTEMFYERKVDAGQITQNQMRALVMALTARAGLEYDEIVGAYARRGTKIANDHLAILKDGLYPTFTCGSNPHFIASIPGLRERAEANLKR